LTAAQRGVVEEVRRALATFDGTRANHERVVAELIPLQELRRAAVDEAFRAGLADATDLLFAEQALQSALARSVALARDVATARIRLQRAVGGPRADAATSSLTQEPLRR
jgi:outer membrane protein TolC